LIILNTKRIAQYENKNYPIISGLEEAEKFKNTDFKNFA